MARVLAFDASSDVSAAGGSPPPPAQQAAAQGRAGASSRPLKRVARFLGDDGSDSDGADGAADDGYSAAAYGSGRDARLGLAMGQKKRTTAEDVDRIFADLDGEEDVLPPPLKRGRLDATQDSMIDDRITAFGNSKGKTRGSGFFDQDGDDDVEDATNDRIDAEKAKKPRRKPVVMNEERLLGDKGIRKLKENLKGFKIKGKGHEEDDLRRLMNVYQLWAHQMFPAGSFRDTISQVEKLCKKRSMKSVLKGWRDEAQGKLPPALARGGSDDDAEGPTRHANSDEDDEAEVLAHNGDFAASTTTSQAGSPSRPKKSYFDDIPTSSPGGALSRDPEMEEDGDMDLTESLFGSAAPVIPTAGPSISRTAVLQQNVERTATSEAGFNDGDLTFDLDEEEDFDVDAEAEAAMREMDAMNGDEDLFQAAPSKTVLAASQEGKEAQRQGRRKSISATTKSTLNFYAEPKASDRVVKDGPTTTNATLLSPSSGSRRPQADLDLEEQNFDDFDFGNEEEDIMREMELADLKQRDREAAALAAERRAAEGTSATTIPTGTSVNNATVDNSTSTGSSKTPSLTTSSSAQEAELDAQEAFDDDFWKSVEDAEQLTSTQHDPPAERAEASADLASPVKTASPTKTLVGSKDSSQVMIVETEQPPLYEEDEEDLYS